MTGTSIAPGPGRELERFRALVFADPALQRELLEAVTPRQFMSLAAVTARRHGIALSEADLAAAMRATQLSWQLRWR